MRAKPLQKRVAGELKFGLPFPNADVIVGSASKQPSPEAARGTNPASLLRPAAEIEFGSLLQEFERP
jgi:hypothetical protein